MSSKAKPSKSPRKKQKEKAEDGYSDSYSDSDEHSSPPPRKPTKPTTKPKATAKATTKATKATSKEVRKAATAPPSPPPSFPPSLKLLGYHSSSVGGIEKAIERAERRGGRSMGLFLRQGRAWNAPPLTPDQIDRFKRALAASSLSPSLILPHGNYLVNLCSPDDVIRSKSYAVFLEELLRCQSLGLPFLNIHPGSSRKEWTVERCAKEIGEAINRAHRETEGVSVVLENTAGAGGTIGRSFLDLKLILSHVLDHSRVGVCLDTCHLYAAGYDITTAEKFGKVMEEFEREIGMGYLKGLHLNDCKSKLGSCSDRHANIGRGNIGLEAFRFVMNDARFNNIPIILETPLCDFCELSLLYSLEQSSPPIVIEGEGGDDGGDGGGDDGDDDDDGGDDDS